MNFQSVKYLPFWFALAIFSQKAYCGDEEKAETLLRQMIVQNKEIKTLQYNAFMSERIKKKFVDKTSFFKINVNPRKIYVKQSFIGITLEGLYVEGFNDNKLLISTVGFPWIQTNLDPRGNRVRNDHHHTIFEAGFGYFVGITETILNKYNYNISSMLSYDGQISMNNHQCHKITLLNIDFHYTNYTVQEGENLPSIALKLAVNDYMILEKNPKISDFWDVKPGQVISVPSDYALKMVLYLDLENLLPILIEVYDDKGLYSSYAYNNLIINTKYSWNEFSPSCKDYHFR